MMLSISPNTKVFLCSQLVDMRYSHDALSGLVTSHFGLNPLCGHIFVFLSRQRDRMKLLSWENDGFGLYYKRLERGTYSWIEDLDLELGGEIDASDFAMILTGINPRPEPRRSRKRKKTSAYKPPHTVPLQLV
jgi:transposase